MRVKNFFQYIFLVVGIIIFFGLVLLLVRNYRQDNSLVVTENSIELDAGEELENGAVSDYFDRSNFDDENLFGGDPYSRYCDGNEGSFNSFTVCAPN